jgi:hypothetical protein
MEKRERVERERETPCKNPLSPPSFLSLSLSLSLLRQKTKISVEDHT